MGTCPLGMQLLLLLIFESFKRVDIAEAHILLMLNYFIGVYAFGLDYHQLKPDFKLVLWQLLAMEKQGLVNITCFEAMS